MEFEELLAHLEQNPADWDSRCAVAQAYYEAEHYTEAAHVISDAPEIPFDEENVLFAATLLGSADPEAGHGLLDQFIEAEPTENAYELKAQLYEMAGDAAAAAECRALIGGQAVAAAEPLAAIPVEPEPEPATPQPKALRPPGEEEEEEAEAEPAVTPAAETALPPGALIMEDAGGHPREMNMEMSQPVPLNVQETAEPAHLSYTQMHPVERSLVVGDGEAVHGVEAPPATNERLGAVTAAVIVHVILALLLLAAKVASPRPNPPQISVSSVANTDEASLDSTTMTKQTQKTAAAVSNSQPVVSSVAFSSFAMPEMDMMSDLSLTSMADNDAGFGMSMSGFGDVSNMGAIPAAMRSRCSMTERMKRLRESGGEDRAERAVRKGLEYLTAQQDKESGAIGHEYKVGMTGLTLLAYLGHCETPESPKFGDSVVNAALYLMDRALKNDGYLVTPDGKGNIHSTYEHAIGTYALAELHTMTKASGKKIPRLESVLKKCVSKIIDAQDPMGGWSYGFEGGKGDEDMSVSGWMIQALKAAYNTGERFSSLERTLDKAVQKYLPAIQDGKGAFKYRPSQPDGKQSLTGAALLSMQIWNEMGSPSYNKGMDYLKKAYANPTPSSAHHGLYDEYYNTQAFFMHGGKEWENYNTKFQPKLLDAQQSDGSWTVGGAKGADGVIMNTAWAVLMLEVYYRYLPTTDKVEDLKVR